MNASGDCGSPAVAQAVAENRLAYWHQRAMQADYNREPLWVTPEEYEILKRDMATYAATYRFSGEPTVPDVSVVFGTEVRVITLSEFPPGTRFLHWDGSRYQQLEGVESAVLHHRNGDPTDNSLDNLAVTYQRVPVVVGEFTATVFDGFEDVQGRVEAELAYNYEASLLRRMYGQEAGQPYPPIPSLDADWSPDLAGGMTIDELLSMEQEWRR